MECLKKHEKSYDITAVESSSVLGSTVATWLTISILITSVLFQVRLNDKVNNVFRSRTFSCWVKRFSANSDSDPWT